MSLSAFGTAFADGGSSQAPGKMSSSDEVLRLSTSIRSSTGRDVVRDGVAGLAFSSSVCFISTFFVSIEVTKFLSMFNEDSMVALKLVKL